MAPGELNFAQMCGLDGSSGSMRDMKVLKSPVYNTEKSLIAPVTPQNPKILETLFREILLSVKNVQSSAASLSPAGLTRCFSTTLALVLELVLFRILVLLSKPAHVSPSFKQNQRW